MSRKQRFSAQEVADAITRNAGIVTAAARELGCSRRTLTNYIGRYASVREACEDARESVVDRAEFRLIERIDAGDTRAIIFALRTLGKQRGWVESHHLQHTGKGEGPIETATEILVGFEDELTDEEIEGLEREHQLMRVEARSRADAISEENRLSGIIAG